ncbi:hypothetical protein EQV97_15695 [Pseudomonas sp. TMW22090]|nr:hypothetical protein [Pseudomonas sp. TMW22090]
MCGSPRSCRSCRRLRSWRSEKRYKPGSFLTEKSAFLHACSLPFAGNFLDYFARLRLLISVSNLGPSLLISDRV